MTPARAAVALLVAATIWLFAGKDDWQRSVAEPGADAAYYYAYLPSLFLDGDIDLTNQYKITGNYYRFGKTRVGRPANVFGIGPAVFQSPFFALGHLIAVVSGDRRDGFSVWETRLSMWSSALFAVAGLIAAWRLSRRRVAGKFAAYVGPLAALAAGPVLYYAVRQPGYAHPYATCLCAWLIERWDASYSGVRPRPLKSWLTIGALAGAMTLARPQLAPWGLVCFAAIVDDIRHRSRTPWPAMLLRWLAALGVSVLFILPQLIAWKALYDCWYLVPQGEDFMRWDQVLWIETLFSARNGLFPWAPLYLPLFLGLFLLVRKAPRLVGWLVVGTLVQAFINGAVWDWWAGGSFGGRRFDSCYIAFALGGAALLEKGVQWFNSFRTSSAPIAYLRSAFAAVALAYAGLALAATIELTARTSINSARIKGGEPPDDVWRERVVGLHGRVASQLSYVASLPARAMFALSYNTELKAYDRLVGVYSLGETYPGLNSSPDKVTDVVAYDSERASGIRPLDGGSALLVASDARVFVAVNRRGRIELNITWVGNGNVAGAWNGGSRQWGVTNTEGGSVTIRTGNIDRCINVLELHGTPGLVLRPLRLRADVGTSEVQD